MSRTHHNTSAPGPALPPTPENDLVILMQGNALFRQRFGRLADRVEDLLSGAATSMPGHLAPQPSHQDPVLAVPTREAAYTIAARTLIEFVEATHHLR